MTISGVTWSGPLLDDHEIVERLPRELAALLASTNGFILHRGALHVRGACRDPLWHSLRHSIEGKSALASLYSDVLASDIPFAQDMFGDQFLLRDGRVSRLAAETGEVEEMADSLIHFFDQVEADAARYLNVSLTGSLEPGQLIFAFPPFCMKSSAGGSKLKACPAGEVIGIHADIARQIRSVPDGGSVEFRWND